MFAVFFFSYETNKTFWNLFQLLRVYKINIRAKLEKIQLVGHLVFVNRQ